MERPVISVMRPVLDATGLIGRYDIKLTWSPQADNSQAGQRDARKANLEMLVVDHIEKVPARTTDAPIHGECSRHQRVTSWRCHSGL